MVSLSYYNEIEFDHLVEFAEDRTIFVAARHNGSGHIRIFLIREKTGSVYSRNGLLDSWEELFGSDRDSIIARTIAARNRQIPTYRINGAINL